MSLSYGPGVNERGFIKDMNLRLGQSFKAAIPRPSKGLPIDLCDSNISYLNVSESCRSLSGWIETRLIGCLKLMRIVKDFKPDLVIMRLGAFPLPQFFLSLVVSTPFAIKHAGPGHFDFFYKVNPIRRITSGFNEFMLKKMLNQSLMIDVVSVIQFHSLIRRYPSVSERTYVIDNGADLSMFSIKSSENKSKMREVLHINEDDFVIGYVGSFPMRRGGKEVVDVVKSLQHAMCIKGIIVGDSGEAQNCRKYVHENGLDDFVNVIGEVDYMEVPKYMKIMDVGFSIRRPYEQHCSELKVRQYLASGLCVVGTPGSNDFLQGYEFARIVSGKSIREISEAVLSLFKEGRAGLMKKRKSASFFAQSELSIESQNNFRLKLLAKAIEKI